MEASGMYSGCGKALIVVLFFGLWCGIAPAREAEMTSREGEVSPHTGYVPVCLVELANDQQEVPFPSSHVTVDGIPFDLVDKAGANNLFLKDAGWSGWKTDVGGYCSAYDALPGTKDPSRLVFHVPVADYTAVYLLAATDNSREYSPVVSFRIGSMGAGKGR